MNTVVRRKKGMTENWRRTQHLTVRCQYLALDHQIDVSQGCVFVGPVLHVRRFRVLWCTLRCPQSCVVASDAHLLTKCGALTYSKAHHMAAGRESRKLKVESSFLRFHVLFIPLWNGCYAFFERSMSFPVSSTVGHGYNVVRSSSQPTIESAMFVFSLGNGQISAFKKVEITQTMLNPIYLDFLLNEDRCFGICCFIINISCNLRET